MPLPYIISWNGLEFVLIIIIIINIPERQNVLGVDSYYIIIVPSVCVLTAIFP